MSWIEKWAGKNKAKPSSFRQHMIPPENRFEMNFVLEAADLRVAIQDAPGDRCSMYTSSGTTRRQRSVSFSLAKVVGKQGSRICLRHLGTDDRNDIWLMVDSDMIRPYPSGLELSVPFGFMNSHSVWNKMIMKVDKEEKLAPKEWFPMHPKDPGNNQFKIGEKIEAVDRRNAQLICPATIADIKGNFVLVSFDGWSGTFDYWAPYNSQDLFPVGWCAKSRHKLQQPGPYYEIGKKTITEYNLEYSVPAKTQKSIKRQQTVPLSSKRKSSNNVTQPVLISQEKCVEYDSDCTHMCVNEEDSKSKRSKLCTDYVEPDGGFKSKSKAFRNLFKMWTEKTALQTKKDNFEVKKKEKCSLNEDESDDVTLEEVKTESKDEGIGSSHTLPESDKMSNEDNNVPMPSDISANQLSTDKPPSPSIINSSVANSIIGDYKYLSDTSGVSCYARSEEISPSIVTPFDSSKRISCITNLPSDPYQWTIDDVQIYLINKNPTLESVAQEFKNHEIDGQALLLLTMNTLRQYMKIKLGPAIKVEHIIKNLLDGKL